MTVRKDDRKLQALIRSLSSDADDWLADVAEQINGDIVLSFGRSPSAPGDPPGVDTGALRASMNVEKRATLNYRINDGVLYGIYLEWGTEHIAPRPFVAPVFMEWRENKLAADMRQAGIFD